MRSMAIKMASSNSEITEAPVIDPAIKVNSNSGKIASVKMHAAKEIKRFKELSDVYFAEIGKLVLFELAAEQTKVIIVDSYLKNTLEPIMAGRRIPGLPQETYDGLRKGYYQSLVDRYIDGKGEQT